MPVSHTKASTDREFKLVHRGIVAVKRLAVMVIRNRLHMPGLAAHFAFGIRREPS